MRITVCLPKIMKTHSISFRTISHFSSHIFKNLISTSSKITPQRPGSPDVSPPEVDDLARGAAHVHCVSYGQRVQMLTHLPTLRELGVDITSIHLQGTQHWNEVDWCITTHNVGVGMIVNMRCTFLQWHFIPMATITPPVIHSLDHWFLMR